MLIFYPFLFVRLVIGSHLFLDLFSMASRIFFLLLEQSVAMFDVIAGFVKALTFSDFINVTELAFTGVQATTDSASSNTFRGKVRVLGSILVSANTMDFSQEAFPRSAAVEIFSMRDCFQMIWIAAVSDTAEVIKFGFSWDRFFENFVKNPMNKPPFSPRIFGGPNSGII